MSENTRFGRTPISCVKINQDKCNNTFGVAPCTATSADGDGKCHNTFVTCQDVENYDKGVQVLKFVNDQTPTLTDGYYFPYLRSAKISPASVNLGGANKSQSAIGTRGTISVTFDDLPNNDRITDPYVTERSYDPLERGTFWTKWRARNQHYINRIMTLETGYLVGGSMVDKITRDFIITKFVGPNAAGKVTIQGKDILALAEDTKAQAPRPSTGSLQSAITAGAGTATLSPAGVGDLEYPASGRVRISKELIAFTRAGDTLTLTTRGDLGTDADSHDAGDNVQLCLEYASQSPADILYDLLLNYADIPAQYLDKTQWDREELDYLPRLYSTTIAEPEGVAKLVGEMCEQMYFTAYWDERTSLVKIRAVRPAQEEEITDLTDAAQLIADSVSWVDQTNELLTQTWVYYGQINPVEKLDEAKNYAVLYVAINTDSQSANANNTTRIKKIYSRWIPATNVSAAEDLGSRILTRYSNVPRRCTFSLDAKDNALWLADFIRVANRLNTLADGTPDVTSLQVIQAAETQPSTKYTYTAQQYLLADPVDPTDPPDPTEPTVREIPIAADLLNVNLRTLHDSQFAAPISGDTVIFTVRQGVVIAGDAAGGGTNVSAPQRDDSNDFYDAGNEVEFSRAVGTVNVLQRSGIVSQTDTAAGAAYHGGGGNAKWLIREYPIATALTTGSWPAGVTLRLVIEAGAQIAGEGGNGSIHSLDTAPHTPTVVGPRKCVAGGDGGHGLEVLAPIEIENRGTISGGGGGGGGVAWVDSGEFWAFCGGGGAGQVFSNVTPNLLGTFRVWTTISEPAGGAFGTGGDAGQAVGASNGPKINAAGYSPNRAWGGARGQNGYASTVTPINEAFLVNNDGGAKGDCVSSGTGLITWLVQGTLIGDRN